MSQDKKTKTQQTSPYVSGEAEWKKSALDIYGPTLGQGQQIYPGERVAPLTPTMTQASDVQGFLDQFAPYRDMPMFGETGTALSGALEGITGAQPISSETAKDIFGRIYKEPTKKRWEEHIRPTIRESYAGPGFWGSARAKAEMEGAQDVADWLGAEEGRFMWDVEQANRQIAEAKAGRSLAAIQPAMAYAGLPTQEAQQRLAGRTDVLGLSGVQQRQQQAEINAAIQRFAEENRITDPENLDIFLKLMGLAPMGGITVRAEEDPGLLAQGQGWAGAIGGVGKAVKKLDKAFEEWY